MGQNLTWPSRHIYRILVPNHLSDQSLSEVWPADITSHLVSFLVMLCSACAAAILSSCSFGGFSPSVWSSVRDLEVRWLTWPLKSFPAVRRIPILACFGCVFLGEPSGWHNYIYIYIYLKRTENSILSLCHCAWVRLGLDSVPLTRSATGRTSGSVTRREPGAPPHGQNKQTHWCSSRRTLEAAGDTCEPDTSHTHRHTHTH